MFTMSNSQQYPERPKWLLGNAAALGTSAVQEVLRLNILILADKVLSNSTGQASIATMLC
jgi:hypothetical protein